MYHVTLPISKSIANRLLLLQAIHGDPLMRVSSDMPDDIIVLHDALQRIRDIFGTPAQYAGSTMLTPPLGGGEGGEVSSLSLGEGRGEVSIPLKNCGTALRFLQVHLAKCYPGAHVTLTGDPRLMERDGKPTTQTTSALILHGDNIPVEPGESPYITMSRRMREAYLSPLRGEPERGLLQEPCWSSAAFWYEYVAIHGGELLLEDLRPDSLQGDRIVADLYATHFGVQTTFTPEGAVIQSVSPKGGLSEKRSVSETVRQVEQAATETGCQVEPVTIDFTNTPDLYPAVALTCECLGIKLNATGTDRLRHKESDRLEAVRLHEVRNDHRMAMALIAAGYINPANLSAEEQKDLQTIIAKSYPAFMDVYSGIAEPRLYLGDT